MTHLDEAVRVIAGISHSESPGSVDDTEAVYEVRGRYTMVDVDEWKTRGDYDDHVLHAFRLVLTATNDQIDTALRAIP
uniref:hypothetical protein n=1 Tax=Actinokineospora sp. CA-119265 TaxID=3239890 RepID=UPI003F492961